MKGDKTSPENPPNALGVFNTCRANYQTGGFLDVEILSD